jgi:hypothetical protein
VRLVVGVAIYVWAMYTVTTCELDKAPDGRSTQVPRSSVGLTQDSCMRALGETGDWNAYLDCRPN